MPANSCINVMQDRTGYIWLSTINGISRFNGINFKEFGKYNDSVSIDGEVRKIIQDNKGIYWIASYEKGLISIDFSQQKEKQIQIFNSSTLSGQDCPPFRTIKCILDDNKGFIWVGTESNGLYRFNKETKSFGRWKLKNPYSSFTESIRCLYQNKDSMIWVGIVNGIIYINPSSGETFYPKTSYSGISYAYPPTVRNICNWNKDTFAVATDRGAYFYLPASQTFVPVFPLTDTMQYKGQEYHDVIKFSDEELWFATVNRGIWYANVPKKKYRYSWQSNIADETIGRQPVYYFYKDKDNHLWVCHSKGLSYLNQQNAMFKNLPFSFYVAQPAKKDFMIAQQNEVAIIRLDSLFILQLSDEYPKALKLLYKNENIGGLKIWWHKRLGYVLNSEKGIFYADIRKQLAVPILLKKDLPEAFKQNGNISQLFIDTLHNNEQWWLTANETATLYRYDCKSKIFLSYNMDKDGSAIKMKTGVYFSRMLKAPNGGLWMATRSHGLFYMPDRTKDVFMHFAYNQPSGKQIPGNYIEDIVLDNDNKLWATIRGIGLVQINWRNTQKLSYTIYGKERGLTYLNLGQIKVDDKNNLWISSLNGLYHFDQHKKWFSYFGQPNGIRNPALTLGSARDSSGDIYFASSDHLLRFNPDDILNKKPAASLHLLSVAVNDRTVDITNRQNLRLKPGENTLRFEFDVLDFDNPAGHYILCKLDGYDTNWLLLQDVFQQTYRLLPGGNYTFRLKKVNADGSHNKEITLAVNIADYYYNTTWFHLLAVVLSGFLIFTGVRIYVNRKLQKQKVILERKQAIELERLRISAELHDDVGGELSAIRLLSEMAQMNKAQNTEQQFKKISASSADLVQKMNEIVWALNVKNDTLQSLISYMHRYAAKYLDDVGIECKFNQPEVIPDYEVDGAVRRNIFLLVKESLNNIVKHANATCVFIGVELSGQLQITIHDNGKGMSREKMTANTGNGLSTMQKRTNDVNGTMQIINHNGTNIVFLIPLQEIHTKV